jgi:hypothetical protein
MQDVQNAIVKAQLQARPGGKAADEAACGVLIAVTGRRGQTYPTPLKEAMVAKMEEVLQTKLAPGSSGRALQPLQWSEEFNGDGSWNGRLRARLNAPTQAEGLHGQLHGMPILVGREWYTLTVSNAFVAAFNSGATAKNGLRGAP